MATRPYEEIAARARASWSPQAREISERLGQQLDLEISDHEVLGRELRAARKAARLTQPELARISAVQQAEISRIERGLGNPTRDTLLRLTAPLGVRLALVPARPAGRRRTTADSVGTA